MAFSEDKTTIIEIPISEDAPVTDDTQTQETTPEEVSAAEAPVSTGPVEQELSPSPLQECEERFKRLAADFANYKRRSETERNELLDLLEARLLNGILTIYDDFRRLSQYTANADEQLAQGIKAVQTKWQAWLINESVEMISPLGQAFNPHLHDALMQQPALEAEQDGQVLHVIEYGYKRRDKVLRHAKVIVGHYESDEQQDAHVEMEPAPQTTGELEEAKVEE